MAAGSRRGGSWHWSRRAAIRGALGAVASLAAGARAGDDIAAHAGDDDLGFGEVALPPELGQTGLQVYVEATGHTVGGCFLDYWRANGAASVYGNPITEPFAAGNGYYSQAFENAIFQYRPEFLHTEEPIVRLMPIGEAALIEDLGGRVAAAARTIAAELAEWYRFNEGELYLGQPLTEPLSLTGGIRQYFEGGAAEAGNAGVALRPISAELADRFGLETAPVERGDLPLFDEVLFWTQDLPDLRGDPAAAGPKWIEISIADQRLWAYQGQSLLGTTLVSTGLDPNATELGMFRVRLKYPSQDMEGFTDATGEVLGFGLAPAGTVPYVVADVPDILYFNLDAEALHGAYWHNNFGQRMSHGCVNLPLDFAAWLYGWAPLGTGAWVHE